MPSVFLNNSKQGEDLSFDWNILVYTVYIINGMLDGIIKFFICKIVRVFLRHAMNVFEQQQASKQHTCPLTGMS